MVPRTVSAKAITPQVIPVTASRPWNMVFRLTPFCRCMGRLSWKEHSPQINRKIAVQLESPPEKFIFAHAKTHAA